MSAAPVRIEGKVTQADGTETEFSLDAEYGYMQWGAASEALSENVELMTALAAASYDHLAVE